MTLEARKLKAVSERQYEVVFEMTGRGAIQIGYSVMDSAGEPEAWAEDAAEQTGVAVSVEVLRAVLAFHHARTVRYKEAEPSVRNVPPWFDPTPLKLSEIEAVDDAEYELRFEEPNGQVTTILERVVRVCRGDSSFLGVDIVADPKVSSRIYPRDVNAVTVAFHRARHAGTV